MSRKGVTRFDFIGSITQNALLRVSCFGEVSHKICSYVFRILGKYRTNAENISCSSEVSQKCWICVYWYSTAQTGHISSAPAKLKYSTCLVFLGSIANIQYTFGVPSKYHYCDVCRVLTL